MKSEKEEIIYLPIFTGLGVSMGLILGEKCFMMVDLE